MKKTSAGLLMYRYKNKILEVFIAHPGGPYYATKDEGAWDIPKGEVNDSEELIDAAQREFHEETGLRAQAPFIPLGTVTLKSGKIVHVWAFEGDWSGTLLPRATIAVEWPPHSGKYKEFPEMDRAGFFTIEQARRKLHPGKIPFLIRLEEYLKKKERSKS